MEWAVKQNKRQKLLPAIVTNKARNAVRRPPFRFVRVIVAPLDSKRSDYARNNGFKTVSNDLSGA